jgi:hypothetical protein
MKKSISWFVLFTVISLLLSGNLSAQIKYLDMMKSDPENFPIKTAFCKRVSVPPVIDGKLDDKAWENAHQLTGFSIVNGQTKAIHQTRAWAVHDGRYLYIAFECLEPEMEKVRAETFIYDNRDILFDDRMEILLDVGHNHKNIIRFVVNSNGVTYATKLERPVQHSISYITGDDRWNTEYWAKTQKYEDRWTGEIAIAIDRIYDEEITPGTTWGLNLVRDRHAEFTYGGRGIRVERTREISAWSPVQSHIRGEISDNHIQPTQYGDLVFDQDQIQVTNLSFHEAYANYNGSIWHKPQFFGDNPIQITLRNNGESDVPIDIIVKTTNFDGTGVIYTKQVVSIAGDESVFSSYIPVRFEERLEFSLFLIDKNTNSTLYNTSYDTRVPSFVEFDLSALYNHDNKVRDYIKVSPVVVPGTLSGARLKLELWHNGTLIARDQLNSLKEYVFLPCFESIGPGDLAHGNYTIKSYLYNGDNKLFGSSEQHFTFNLPVKKNDLSAHETVYSFGGKEGEAIVVDFPDGEKFVFWEHASYIPWWDLQNMAVTYQFVESWGHTTMGCAEPMQDKENRYSKAEIIENTPARVVILWRYALSDPNYRIIFNEWVHEYFYFYPDGTGVREILLWANSDVPHEIVQPQFIYPTGVIPEQMFQDTTVAVFNLEGDLVANRINEPLILQPEDSRTWDEEVLRIFLKDRKHPYMIWSKRDDIVGKEISRQNLVGGDVRFSMGGHWPNQPMNVDVYSVVGTNSIYHGWIGNIHVFADPGKHPNRWIHLIGATNRDNGHLIKLGKNWLYPSGIDVKGKDYVFERFDVIQKAYILKNTGNKKSPSLNFSFSGDETSIINPVLILKDVGIDVKNIRIGRKNLDNASYRTGIVSGDSGNKIIIWINQEIPSGISVSIQFDERP